jgi:hypothetical protein
LSVLLLLLQAAVPLVHHAGENESCITAPLRALAATADSGTALDQTHGTEAQRPNGHDPLHCLFCRTISRLDGNGQFVPQPTLIAAESSSQSIPVADEIIFKLDLTGECPTRAPPVSV